MAKNIITYYEDACITEIRGGLNWKVEIEEEENTIIFVNKKIVNEIFSNSNATEESLIALLLAYIEYVRRTMNFDSSKRPRRIEEEYIQSAITNILSTSYPIESIIEWVKTAKWHEVKTLLTSDNPSEMIGEYI